MKRILAAAVLLLAGCVSLTPYAELRERLPPNRFVEVAGREVYVEQQGEGEAVLLLHGFGASSYSWRHVLPRLADRHRVIAVDLNGFGYTERPRGAAGYTVGGQLALVLGVMDALGLDSAHVAGHSYGGALAAHLAWRHPDRVRSLILVDAAGLDYPWTRRHPAAAIRPLSYLFIRSMAIRRSAIEHGLRRSFADDSQITPAMIDAYFERIAIEGVSRAYRGLTAPSPEPEALPDPQRLDLPVMLVWGSEDELVGPEEGRKADDLLPRSRFTLLEGVGHIPLEESPEELARVMLDFLQDLPGPGAPDS